MRGVEHQRGNVADQQLPVYTVLYRDSGMNETGVLLHQGHVTCNSLPPNSDHRAAHAEAFEAGSQHGPMCNAVDVDSWRVANTSTDCF